ncbi:LamG-like jellyroll fold domain-containing protein [Kribbella sp. NPDC056861]|uniref:LamG-like jellyroll fold domain-containing protein n=1 Tax=Kribbella sp. NPDC056861 TaxID=3154857 RepID=UPI0034141D95
MGGETRVQGTPQESQSASKRAVASKQRVEVVEKRTEMARTFANPDGSFTLEQSNVPVRTKRDGQWVELDATLAKSPDGRVRPKAAAMELSFSGGGTSELITMKSDGHEMTLSWPEPLPEPTISGDGVTYPNVFPDVDLKITAGTSSYSEVLVVKTPEAARLPQLQRLDFAVKAPTLAVAKVAGGVTLAKDKFGKVIFTSPAPVAWDSRGTGQAPTDEDRSESPLEGDKVVPIPLEVGKSSMRVSPSAALMNDAAVKYPIYIDPAFHSTQFGRAMINQHYPTTATWQWEGPEGVGYQEFEPWSRKRLMYHMRIAGLQYTHITKAVFSGYETWAASCTKKEVQLWKTSAITPSITWNSGSGSGTWLKKLDSVVEAVGRDGCTPGGKWIEFDATAAIAEQAADGSQYAYLGLRAASETDSMAWKRFGKAVRLDIIYNHVPVLSNAHSTSPTMGCPTSTAPLKVSQDSPVPTVKILDVDRQPSRVDYEFRQSGVATPLWTGSSLIKASSSTVEYTPASNVSGLKEDVLIGWRARAWDGIDYSAWSGYCWFIIDLSEPPPPKITVLTTAPGDIYPLRQPIDVKLEVTTNDPNHFKYSIDSLEPGAEVVSIDATKSGTFRFTPVRTGPLVIRSWSIDRAGNRSVDFNALTVRIETGPFTGRWYLDEGTGTTSRDSSGKAHDFNLGTAASWAAGDSWDSTSTGANDWSVKLPGTSSIATAASNVVDTSRNFTVSARVRVGAKTTRQVAVSEDRAGAGGFMLGFLRWDLTNPDERKAVWSFSIPDPDGTGQITVASEPISYELGDWVYLTGSYNSADRELSLVLGDNQHQTTIEVPGTATAPDGTGVLRLGSALDAGVQNHFLDGQVDDVRIYPGPIDEATLSINYEDSTPTE